MPHILAIETAINSHSIALLCNGKIDLIQSSELFKQSDNLFVHINEILARNGIGYRDLDKIVVTIGPGSFTGIRIGVAAVRGIKKALPQLEIAGYTTMELMAFQMIQQTQNQNKYICLLNAFASEYYYQEFDKFAKATSDISVVSQNNLPLVSDQFCYVAMLQDQGLFKNQGDIHFITIDAMTLLNKALINPDDAKNVHPLYVKPPNIHGHNQTNR